jgi:hypothetical protein
MRLGTPPMKQSLPIYFPAVAMLALRLAVLACSSVTRSATPTYAPALPTPTRRPTVSSPVNAKLGDNWASPEDGMPWSMTELIWDSQYDANGNKTFPRRVSPRVQTVKGNCLPNSPRRVRRSAGVRTETRLAVKWARA